MTNTLTRSQARTWTLSAQIASAICVLGAVALGIVGLPSPQPGAAIEQARAQAWPAGSGVSVPGTAGKGGVSSGTEPGDGGAIDSEGLAQRFALLDNAPKVVDNSSPAETQPDPDSPPAASNDGLIVKRVRYIGFINDPTTRHAFIRIDGKQRIVAEGGVVKSGDEQFSDLTVERVTAQNLFLTDGQTRAVVPLAIKSGPSVTMVTGDQIAVATTTKGDESLLTPEEEATIAALPPRQQPGARRRLEREKRGLPAEERRRPQPEALVTVRGSMNASGSAPSRRERQND